MKNLAGVKECDATIMEELEKAGILPFNIARENENTEVPYGVIGRLGDFEFRRAWYYWVVKGSVPLNVAEEMYNDPTGKKDVRVAGHCGCPPPENWAFPEKESIVAYLKNAGRELSITNGELANLCNAGEIKGERFVNNYHIDSQAGLNLFVATIKKHGLVSPTVKDLQNSMKEQREKPDGAFATRILNAITLSMNGDECRIDKTSKLNGDTLGSIRSSLYELGKDGNQFDGWPDSEKSKTGNPIEEAVNFIEFLAGV